MKNEKLQRCNGCMTVQDEGNTACEKCGRDDCLMYPFTPIKQRIIITMEGGIIQNISGIPEDVLIEVHDFDTDSYEGDSLHTNDQGEEFILMEWEA